MTTKEPWQMTKADAVLSPARGTLLPGAIDPPMTTEQLRAWDAFRGASAEYKAADGVVLASFKTPKWRAALEKRDAISDRLWEVFDAQARSISR